jgi:hypothetical protein
MLSLHPGIVDNEVGDGIPVAKIMDHLPLSKEAEWFAVMQYDQTNTQVRLAIPSRSQKSAYFVCECRHPFVNIVGTTALFRPNGKLFVFDDPASDASSEDSYSEDSSSDGTSDDRKPRNNATSKRDRSEESVVLVKVSRPRYLHNFGSPMKKGKDNNTPKKYHARLATHPSTLTSPEHRPVKAIFSKVQLSDTLRIKLSGSPSPKPFNRAYKEMLKENPRLPVRALTTRLYT